jgi:hypothetical protein
MSLKDQLILLEKTAKLAIPAQFCAFQIMAEFNDVYRARSTKDAWLLTAFQLLECISITGCGWLTFVHL